MNNEEDVDQEFIEFVNDKVIDTTVIKVEADLYRKGAYEAYDFLMSRWERLVGSQPKPKSEAKDLDKRSDNDPVMPFGKHKGCHVSQLPPSYIEWCLENLDRLDPDLRSAMEATQ